MNKFISDTIRVCSLVIAHAGDGNFHTIILFDPSKDDQRKEAERLNHFMVHTALSMEGTSSHLLCFFLSRISYHCLNPELFCYQVAILPYTIVLFCCTPLHETFDHCISSA